MRLYLCGVIILLSSAVCFGQDKPTYEQLEKAHQDTLTQLKNAQDRRNQLATENEQLQAKAVDLQKDLDAAHAELADLRRQEATWAEQTFFLRSMYAAWQDFLMRYPRLRAEWEAFLARPVLDCGPLPDLPREAGEK